MKVKAIALIVFSFLLAVGCAKSDFEACVEFYEEKAKRDKPDEWREYADGLIGFECKVS